MLIRHAIKQNPEDRKLYIPIGFLCTVVSEWIIGGGSGVSSGGADTPTSAPPPRIFARMRAIAATSTAERRRGALTRCLVNFDDAVMQMNEGISHRAVCLPSRGPVWYIELSPETVASVCIVHLLETGIPIETQRRSERVICLINFIAKLLNYPSCNPGRLTKAAKRGATRKWEILWNEYMLANPLYFPDAFVSSYYLWFTAATSVLVGRELIAVADRQRLKGNDAAAAHPHHSGIIVKRRRRGERRVRFSSTPNAAAHTADSQHHHTTHPNGIDAADTTNNQSFHGSGGGGELVVSTPTIENDNNAGAMVVGDEFVVFAASDDPDAIVAAITNPRNCNLEAFVLVAPEAPNCAFESPPNALLVPNRFTCTGDGSESDTVADADADPVNA